jgi:hypothetical protein
VYSSQLDRKKRKIDEEKSAFGTYAGDLGTTFTYRVKKPGSYGGYKVVTTVCALLQVARSACAAGCLPGVSAVHPTNVAAVAVVVVESRRWTHPCPEKSCWTSARSRRLTASACEITQH